VRDEMKSMRSFAAGGRDRVGDAELGPVTMRKPWLPSRLARWALLASLPWSLAVPAAEGGSSLYVPGTAGDVAMAVPGKPGWTVSDLVFVQTGNVNRAVLQGAVNANLELDVVLNFVGVGYTFEHKVLGATYNVGAVVPFGNVKLAASLAGPRGRSVSAEADSFNIADSAITPLLMQWSFGNMHLELGEAIVIPTGDYDLGDAVNLGRNYWAFDTTGSFTYLNPEAGRELSAQAGIMVNLKNEDTDYKTGKEFHLDFAMNQFLAKSFAIGLRGYYYKQVSGDSGSGAVLGAFKGESFGIGPGFFWQPGFAQGKMSIVGKWMHDLTATNRLESDYVSIGVAYSF